MAQSFEHQWEEFYTNTISKDGVKRGSHQYVETRRGFYGGLISLYSEMVKIARGGQESAAITLEEWDRQMHVYISELHNGLS